MKLGPGPGFSEGSKYSVTPVLYSSDHKLNSVKQIKNTIINQSHLTDLANISGYWPN